MAASSFQEEQVQKVQFASFNATILRFPGARRACRVEIKA
jgi:hypothetical protein